MPIITAKSSHSANTMWCFSGWRGGHMTELVRDNFRSWTRQPCEEIGAGI
jgi:hypothetical protein